MTNRHIDDPLTPWTHHVPSNWGLDRLANVAEIRFSNVDKHTIEGEVPVRLCNYIDVYNHERITANLDFMEASAEQREIVRFQLRIGDVLATKDSETPDDIAISALVVDELPELLCGYHLALMRPLRHKLYGPYLAWLHVSKAFRAQYEARAVGVTRWGLSRAAFKEALVPIPPLAEQQLIADYLDGNCAAIDAAISTKRRQLKNLDDLFESSVFEAVTQGLERRRTLKPSGLDWLPEIPENWEVQQIKRRCSLLRGRFVHRPRNDPALYDGPYPFVQTGDITAAEKYIRGYSQTLNENGLRVSKMFPKATLVMSIAANVGDVAILDFEACFPDSMVGLVPNHKTSLDFLYYLLRSMKSILLRSAVLTTQLNLNYVRIGTNFAPFPPKEEQDAIARFLDARFDHISQIKAVLKKQVDALIAYRDSLIHECVTGQRRVTRSDETRIHVHA